MAQVLMTFQSRLLTDDGTGYRALACGREKPDGLWEGWIEFVPDDGPVVRTGRETTQPNLMDLEYWASGLTPVYLEGALKRAMRPLPPPVVAPAEIPAYEGPQPPIAYPDVEVPVQATVLDPFSLYARAGENRLRQQLSALSSWHLRSIIQAYQLADELDVDVGALTEPELVGVIVAAVRLRAA